MSHRGVQEATPREVFDDPVVQLAAICPICALAALNPAAALAALTPVLRIFNPATNINAAMLSFLVGMVQQQPAVNPPVQLAQAIHARVAGKWRAYRPR